MRAREIRGWPLFVAVCGSVWQPSAGLDLLTFCMAVYPWMRHGWSGSFHGPEIQPLFTLQPQARRGGGGKWGDIYLHTHKTGY